MKRLILIGVVCTFAAASARADLYGTVQVEYVGLIRGMDLSIASSASYGAPEFVEGVGLHRLGFTNLNLGGDGTVAIPADSYFQLGSTAAFCIDLWDSKPETVPAPQYNVRSLNETPDWAAAPIGGMGVPKAQWIAKLLIDNSYATALEAAAVQVAIWEIIDENHFLFGGSNPWDVSAGAGNFYLDTSLGNDSEIAVASLANAMLGNLGDSGLPFGRYTAVSNGPGSKNWQDFVVVPVPAAFLLGFLGLGIAGVKLRRFA